MRPSLAAQLTLYAVATACTVAAVVIGATSAGPHDGEQLATDDGTEPDDAGDATTLAPVDDAPTPAA